MAVVLQILKEIELAVVRMHREKLKCQSMSVSERMFQLKGK